MDGDGHDQQQPGARGASLWPADPGFLLVWPGVFQRLQPAVHRPFFPGAWWLERLFNRWF